METNEKTNAFANELAYIKREDIRLFTMKAIELLPDYFFSMPASSTGKYHPEYSLGEGGLLRHTRAAVRIAVDMSAVSFYNLTSDDVDIIVASLILHDGWKKGVIEGVYTLAEHPNIAVNTLKSSPELSGILPDDVFQMILDNIQTHMGQWNTDFKNPTVKLMPEPSTRMQEFVHLCDYLASRKSITMNFNIPVMRSRS